VFRPAEDYPIRWLDGEGHVLPIPQKPSCAPLQRASYEQRHAGHTGLRTTSKRS
jgi:hypothetical protein